MSNELSTMPPEDLDQVTQLPANTASQDPFSRASLVQSAAVNQGAVAIEIERAVAEAQGRLTLAKKFPRDVRAAYAELSQACQELSLARVAFYTVPRGEKSVSGPSIRLAEECGRIWGNMYWGHRELSRSGGKSEVEVFAWDMQTNTISSRQMTVVHVLDTRNGPRALRDQKDVDDKIANVASKQQRGRLLAVLPKWFTEAAKEMCKATLAKGDAAKPMEQRRREMLAVFTELGVKQTQIEDYLEKKLDETNDEDMLTMRGVYNAIKNEGVKASEYFGSGEPEKTVVTAAVTGTSTDVTPAATRPPVSRRTPKTPPPADTGDGASQAAAPPPAAAPATQTAATPPAGSPAPGSFF